MLSLEGESKRWSKGKVVIGSEVGECDFLDCQIAPAGSL